ncbi:MAG: CDP-glycerol glycerophosphotransferase family protein [Microbacterium sp.]|uniref:CDP-glycerol glycerophosphotransferase family protein n=1 Tax=Microbacterium sp. TaxID=51671 RepID=UPI003A8B3FD5
MASFSFGAGNAHKLARIPLFFLGRLITFAVPRRRGAWVFGCGVGIADGTLALWQAAARPGAVWLTGSARERADAAARGIPSLPKHSLCGFWATARASVVVVTHGFGDVNRYAVGGAFVVQLWHGIPLKRIGLDSPATVRAPGALRHVPGLSRLIAMLYRGAAHRIDLLPAASHLVRGRFESAFGLPDERVAVTGEPRVDVLSQGEPEARRAAARTAVEAHTGPVGEARLWLYAPTWRDGAPDPAVPTSAQWRALVDVLAAQDAILLVRSHPLGAGDYALPFATDRVRLLGSDLLPDVTPVLPGLDTLITDYSSLAFDAGLVPLPVVYLAPDVDDYACTRGFYGRYADVAGPDPAADWDEACTQLAALADPTARAERVARSRALSARVHRFDDGHNTARVHRAILDRSGGGA